MYGPSCGTESRPGASFYHTCGQDARAGQPIAPPGMPAGGQTYVGYAGFWKRFAAWIIDTIITTVVFSVLRLIVLASFGDIDDSTGGAVVAAYAVNFIGQWLYYAGMESSVKRATLGKMALSISVTDVDGRRITFMRATGRYFGKIISGLILLIGYLMVAWTEKKQGLHDKMAGTLVVNKPQGA